MSTTRLALFDLDNTLLAGDSDHAWGEFLIKRGMVDAQTHRARNDSFYEDYKAGQLDIHAYVAFTLEPILGLSQTERDELRSQFLATAIQPLMLPKAESLLQDHRQRGDRCVIITATNRFITEPIAAMLGVADLLATDLVMQGERLNGAIDGEPCYQEGKISKLEKWLNRDEARREGLRLDNSIFYSDSINDLPLLAAAGQAVAVDPDDRLRDEARKRGWPVTSLR
jgi:HAD superfamily hydrolase (TIGR01490 family)